MSIACTSSQLSSNQKSSDISDDSYNYKFWVNRTANWRGSQNIEPTLNKQAIIFFEDFEEPDYHRHWKLNDGRPIGSSTVSEPAELVFLGNHSAVMECQEGRHETLGDGKLVLDSPIDGSAYVRLYLLLSKDFNIGRAESMYLFSIIALVSNDFYRGAGHRPTGKDRFGVALAINRWNELYLYYYHPEQRSGYGDKIFSNKFLDLPIVESNKWYCLELMLRPNQIGKRDGKIKAWVNGKLSISVDQMHLRDIEEVKIRQFRMTGYFSGRGFRGTSPKDQKIYIDNYVISLSRIGCT